MAALTSTSDLIASLRSPLSVMKPTAGLTIAALTSNWLSGGLPGAGTAPASAAGALCNANTSGALSLPVPTATQDTYLAALELSAPQGCQILLLDRLMASAALNGTVITAQAVGSPALDLRYPDSVGNLLFLEVYSVLGATTTTATVSYTNQAGVAGKTGTLSIPANAPLGRLLPVLLAAGDTGVQSVQSVTLAGSTGTAGNFGVTIARLVASLSPQAAYVGQAKDFAALGLPKIGTANVSQACLQPVLLASSGVGGSIIGSYSVALK